MYYYIYIPIAGVKASNYAEGKVPKDLENMPLEEYEK